MGKTTSLLHLYSVILEKHLALIPIFIPLYECQQTTESDNNWILRYIATTYFSQTFPYDFPSIQKSLSSQDVLILLDGWNEIKIEGDLFIQWIKELLDLPNIRIMISSRKEFAGINKLGHHRHQFERLELQPLDKSLVRTISHHYGVKIPRRLIDSGLCTNPMILTIYMGIEREMEFFKNWTSNGLLEGKLYCFRKIQSLEDILYNYVLSQKCRADQKYPDAKDTIITRICYDLVLPSFAFLMAAKGEFQIDEKVAFEHISRCATEINDREKLSLLSPDVLIISDEYLQVSLTNFSPEIDNELLLKLLLNRYRIMVRNEGKLLFIHQHFRDYFASYNLRRLLDRYLNDGNTQFVTFMSEKIDDCKFGEFHSTLSWDNLYALDVMTDDKYSSRLPRTRSREGYYQLCKIALETIKSQDRQKIAALLISIGKDKARRDEICVEDVDSYGRTFNGDEREASRLSYIMRFMHDYLTGQINDTSDDNLWKLISRY